MGRYKWSLQEEILLELLKKIRAEAAISGPFVQDKLGRPNSYVTKIESGDKRLDVLELNEYCRVCGISLPEFSSRLEEQLKKRNI